MGYKDRIKNSLFGVMYGDALGAPVEKLSANQIHEKFGRVESLDISYHKDNLKVYHVPKKQRSNGIFTDDTLMTFALIRVYNEVRSHIDVYNMNKEFVKEIAFKPVYIPEFGYEALIVDRIFHPEKFIFLKHTLASSDPRTAGVGNMVNCGAMMYVAPIGIVNACNSRKAYDEAINFAQGHQYSYGLEAAGVFSACVAKAFEEGVSVEDIIDTAIYYAKDGTKEAIKAIKECVDNMEGKTLSNLEVYHALQDALKPYSTMGDDIDRRIEKVGIPTDDYTPSRLKSIEELPIALGIIYHFKGDIYKLVQDGINSGRDTDSIGVVIGAIVGAMNDENIIEKEVLDKIEEINKVNLEEITNDFYNTIIDIHQQDLKDYLDIEKKLKKLYN